MARDNRYLKIIAARHTAVKQQQTIRSTLIRMCPHDDDDGNICITKTRRLQEISENDCQSFFYLMLLHALRVQAGDQGTKVKGHVHCHHIWLQLKQIFSQLTDMVRLANVLYEKGV